MRVGFQLLMITSIMVALSSPIVIAEGRLLYVSPNGDDSNPGTEKLPWKSLAAARSKAMPGDTVFLRDGTYGEKLIAANSGTMGAPIAFKAYPGEQPIIDGTRIPLENWGGLVRVDGKRYLHIDGIQVRNAKNFGIFVFRSTNVRIEHCLTIDTQDSGIMAWDSSNIQISENEVKRGSLRGMAAGAQEGISVSNTDNFSICGNHVHHGGMEGIDAKDGCRNGSIFGNNVHNQKAVGIYVDAWGRHQSDIEVFNNICHSNHIGIAIASENGGLIERIKVHDNICFWNDMAGFVLAGWNRPTEHPLKDISTYRNLSWGNERGFVIACIEKAFMEDIKFYNNVAYWNKRQGFGFWGESDKRPGLAINNIEIINNTIVGNGLIDAWDAGGIQMFNISIKNLLIRNNIISDNRRFTIFYDSHVSPEDVTIDYNLINGFRGLGEEKTGTHVINGNPGFMNETKGDFHLTGNSPAVDRGSSDKAPEYDFSMVERPQGREIDLGAYEYMP